MQVLLYVFSSLAYVAIMRLPRSCVYSEYLIAVFFWELFNPEIARFNQQQAA
jgi:hypothetical protein